MRLNYAPPIVLAISLFLSVSACGDNQDAGGAQTLWEQIRADGYTKWGRAPGYDTRQPSKGPHGETVDIYLNDVMLTALKEEGLSAWPQGSLIVKDIFENNKLTHVAAMEKGPEKWFWAEWKADGTALYSGEPDACTGCHADGDDMVLAFSFPSKVSDESEIFWSRLQEADYTQWNRAPGYDTRQPAAGPHGDAVDIYVNDVVQAALQGNSLAAWPEGSLIVKDIFSNDQKTHVAAMKKVSGKWYWAEWKADGTKLYAGEPGLCTGCHATGDDSLMSISLPQ